MKDGSLQLFFHWVPNRAFDNYNVYKFKGVEVREDKKRPGTLILWEG